MMESKTSQKHVPDHGSRIRPPPGSKCHILGRAFRPSARSYSRSVRRRHQLQPLVSGPVPVSVPAYETASRAVAVRPRLRRSLARDFWYWPPPVPGHHPLGCATRPFKGWTSSPWPRSLPQDFWTSISALQKIWNQYGSNSPSEPKAILFSLRNVFLRYKKLEP